MFEKLLEPGRIGTMPLRNHILMGPTETHFTREDGCISPEEIAYYVERARGGAALITTHQVQANTKIDPIDPYPRSARLDDDAFIPMMGELTDAVHLEGAKISVLLTPGGGAQALGVPYDAGSDGMAEVLNVAPGTIRCPVANKPVRPLTIEEIHQTVINFGKAAGRAQRAGFDAVTIHAHFGYLIAQFLSPFFNNRTDEYGGSLANRARFLMELIAETRKNVGPRFPIILRIAIDEKIGEAGRQIEESVELCKMAEAAGVDAIDCAAGLMMSIPWLCPTVYHEKAALAPLSKQIKDAVSIPVIVQGRLQDPEIAEQVLENGQADFVSLSRAWIAEPEWAKKVACGDAEGIRRCVSCNHCIGDRIANLRVLRCRVNPIAGREWKFGNELPKAQEKKHIAVIGAGPSGLEIAYRCGSMGHEIDIYDKTDRFCGGQIMAAKASPGKEVLNNVPRYYEAQLAKLPNVHVHLNTELNEEAVKHLDCDVIVLATGGHPFVPPIPGIREAETVTAPDVLTKKVSVNGKILIAGGGQTGVECAYMLMGEGYDVSIIEMLPMLGSDEEQLTHMTIMPVLEEMGLKSFVSHQILKVNANNVQAKNLLTGGEVEIPFDTLITSLGTRPETVLLDAVKASGKPYHVVGDAVQAGNIRAAIESGFFTAQKI